MGDAAHEDGKPGIPGLPSRVRDLLRYRNMTLQELADASGIPKRSLENYLRSSSPQVPGLEAAAKIAAALHTSLDWLVLSDGSYPDTSAKLTSLAARAAALTYLKDMVKYDQQGATVVTDGKILGFTPDALAIAIGESAALRARAVVELGGGL